MNQFDAVYLGGLLLSSWAAGFGCGLLISTFRKLMDKI